MDNQRLYLQKKYLKLPEELKRAIFSVENAKIIQELSQKYHLPTEKMRCLAKTAGLVLLGEIKIQDFNQEIQKSCGFIPETANMISQEINEKIFAKIKSFLEIPEQHDRIKQDLSQHGIEIKKPEKISNSLISNF